MEAGRCQDLHDVFLFRLCPESRRPWFKSWQELLYIEVDVWSCLLMLQDFRPWHCLAPSQVFVKTDAWLILYCLKANMGGVLVEAEVFGFRWFWWCVICSSKLNTFSLHDADHRIGQLGSETCQHVTPAHSSQLLSLALLHLYLYLFVIFSQPLPPSPLPCCAVLVIHRIPVCQPCLKHCIWNASSIQPLGVPWGPCSGSGSGKGTTRVE